jgi:hypothetical protein
MTKKHASPDEIVERFKALPTAAGTAASLGVRGPERYFRVFCLTRGERVAWIVRLVQIGADGNEPFADVMTINRPDDLDDIANLGLTVADGKRVLAGLQQEIVAAQARSHSVQRPECRRCSGVCHLKDYRNHAVATHLGQVTVRLPRFRCARCGAIEAGVGWPSHCRSTPEFDRLRAHFTALIPYRMAADVLKHVFPVDAGKDPETVRRCTLKVGATLRTDAVARPELAAAAVVVTLHSTFIRSCEDGERHLEVRVGNVETETGGRQVFGAVAKTDTHVKVLICQSLDAVGRTEDTVLTAFTDGCSGLRRILADAGITELAILDWFHIGMRLQHLKQTANGLSADNAARVAAKAVIVEKVVDRIARAEWLSHRPERLDGQLCRAPPCRLRVGTAITEGTANFLVNRRMNKSQQMRWSRRGANLLLQVRCAVYNGTLGSGYGQKFHPANDTHPHPQAIAA